MSPKLRAKALEPGLDGQSALILAIGWIAALWITLT